MEKKKRKESEESLANLRPAWSKGESGNPNGRPKGALGRATIARRWLEANTLYNNELTGEEELLSQEDIITLAIIRKAKAGDVNAYKELLNSAYGQATQPIEIDSPSVDLSGLTTEELKALLNDTLLNDTEENGENE